MEHPGPALPRGAEVSEHRSTIGVLEENAEAASTHRAGRGNTSRQAQPSAWVLVGKPREKSRMSPRECLGWRGVGRMIHVWQLQATRANPLWQHPTASCQCGFGI